MLTSASVLEHKHNHLLGSPQPGVPTSCLTMTPWHPLALTVLLHRPPRKLQLLLQPPQQPHSLTCNRRRWSRWRLAKRRR